jgi:hypothetical protein
MFRPRSFLHDNTRSRLLIASLLILLGSASVLQAGMRAGAALRVITPDPLLPITGGMGPTEPARGKKGDLTVRAVVVEHGSTRLAIVSVDALGFPSALGKRVAAAVPEIPAANLLIGATHTHSAPDFYAFPDGKGGHSGDLAYMDSVCVKIAEAIREAVGRLTEVELRIASGEVEGRVAYNYYAPDLYDRRAGVLQWVTPGGKTIATLVNYAVHPEVLGASQGICSPDLIGPLCDRLESRFGGMAMFMNGAQGGMITADNRDLERPSDATRGYWNDLRTWEECLRIGNTLADESARLIEAAQPQTNPGLQVLSREVRFPVDSDDLWAVVQYSPLKYARNEDRSVTARLNAVQIGTARILTIPGEALPNVGFYLKRKMAGEHNLLFGLTNDAFGYIMTKVDFESFPRYDYISRVSLGEMTGEILIDQGLDLTGQLAR